MRLPECFIGVIVCAAVLLQRASGQAGPWARPYEVPLKSQITSETIDVAKSILRLSPEQHTSLLLRLAEHQNRFDELKERWQPVMVSFDDQIAALTPNTIDHVDVQVAREKALAPAAAEQAQLDSSFLAQIQAILTEEQHETYPQFVARVHRMWWRNPNGFIDGGIDLAKLAEETIDPDLLAAPELQQILLNYDLQMGEALKEQADFHIKIARHAIQRQLPRMQNDGVTISVDMATPEELSRMKAENDRRLTLYRRVRDVNRNALKSLQAILPQDDAAALEQAYLHEALRYEHGGGDPLKARSFLSRVLALTDLSDDQRQAITAIADEFNSSSTKLQWAIISASDSFNSARYDGAGRQKLALHEEATAAAVSKLREASIRMAQSVHSLLTPEQQANVPLLKTQSANEAK